MTAGQLVGFGNILLDLQAGLGHARGVGQGEVFFAGHRDSGLDLDLALPVIVAAQGFFCVIHRCNSFASFFDAMIPSPPPQSQEVGKKLGYFYTIFRGIFPDICRKIQKFHSGSVFLDKRGNFEYSL
jgi:hypothetical protein